MTAPGERPRFYISCCTPADQAAAMRLGSALRARFGTLAVLPPPDGLATVLVPPEQVRDHLRDLDVLLVIVGPGWQPDQALRACPEMTLALSSDQVVIVPVLTAGASLPAAAALEEGLRELAEWPALTMPEASAGNLLDEILSALEARARLARNVREALDEVHRRPTGTTLLRLRQYCLELPASRRARLERLARAAEGRLVRSSDGDDGLTGRVEELPKSSHGPGAIESAEAQWRREAERRRIVEEAVANAAALEARERAARDALLSVEEQLWGADADRPGPAAPNEKPPSRDTGAIRVVRSPQEAGLHHLDENVQFTVFRPSTVQPARWYPLLAFAHLSERRPDDPPDAPDPVAEMQAQAARALGDAASQFRSVTEDSGFAVVREGELRFVPLMEGVEFNPRERRFLWTEPVHGEHFRMRASRALDGRVARGTLTVYAGNLLLADVRFSVRVQGGARDAASEPSAARPYRHIFASYSHRDTPIVEEFEAHAKATGDRYLRDVVSLRAGEVWDDRLRTMINQADVFQLFWSWNALASPMVRAEWQYALALNRAHFVRPVYWEEPLPEQADLPPPQLRQLHFQRVYPRAVAAVPGAVAAPPDVSPRHIEAVAAPPAATHVESLPPPQKPYRAPSGTRSVVKVARYGSVAAAAVLAVGLYVAMQSELSRAPDSGSVSSPSTGATPSNPTTVLPERNGAGAGRADSKPPETPAAAPPAPDPGAGRGGRTGGGFGTTGRIARGRGTTPAAPGPRGAGPQGPARPADPDNAPPPPPPPPAALPSDPAPSLPGQVPREARPERTPSDPSGRAGIERALGEYQRALESQDLAGLQRVWMMPREEEERLRLLFRRGGAVHVSLRIVENRRVTETRAEVLVEESRAVVGIGPLPQRQTSRRLFHLEQHGDRWRIVSILDAR